MDKMILVRLIVFVFAWVNQLLASKGYEPLPVLSETEIANTLALIVSVWTLFTNNSVKKVDK